jgi:N-acetylglucosaminyl-diphospho-decaprenol L-rhamnosyltransferase
VDNQLSTSDPTFSVIIVNYNSGDFLQGALSSLAAQTRRDFEVILVDNASSDGSIDDLDTSGLPAFRLMAETENHGFARGNNLGAAHAQGAWLVLLNPDAEAHPDWLEQIAAGMARHPDVSSFASLQLKLGCNDLMDGAGDNYLIFGIPWRGGYGRSTKMLPEEGECFSPCGASAVIRKKLFLEVGGFDERLFCYCEDVDLGFRLQLMGERCVFIPKAIVQHAGGGSTEKVSGFAVRLGTRNRLWVYVKNMPLVFLILGAPVHAALTAAILLRGLSTHRFKDAWTGLMEGLAGLGPVWADRKDIQAQRLVKTRDLLSLMAWNPLTMLSRKTHVLPFRTLGIRPGKSGVRTVI